MQVVENVLYIQTEPSYLHLDHDQVVIEQTEPQSSDGKKVTKKKQGLPLLAFGGIVLFGNVMISPALIGRCAEDGRTITILDRNGRFRARIDGPVSGNVLLRQAQYNTIADTGQRLEFGRSFIAGKLANSRHGLLRSARDAKDSADEAVLRNAAGRIKSSLGSLRKAGDLDEVRGIEGDAARLCFSVFKHQLSASRDVFGISGRTRRPPLDPMNALLSYLYTLLTHDCRSALEGVGLDPQAGFLHALRPGRPALALDLMEEFRPILGDRLALTLVNRRQITPDDFVKRPGGAVRFTDDARKKVIVAYVERKRKEIKHSITGKSVSIALLPHIQARLIARVLRKDLESYPPYVLK
ncbi:MAG: type I-C CRISPR-associated endonuclease Cas1c [Candidatus Hatepunaea meridiana]|nr:type I-C CRISPR-associated endonuclease Cas1c [Candidatus Hatepunaea meridiana]